MAQERGVVPLRLSSFLPGWLGKEGRLCSEAGGKTQGGAPQGASLMWGEERMQEGGQGSSQSPPGSPVSVSMYLASSRDVPGVEPKGLAQTSVAPAQQFVLLTSPQSTNLPIIDVQRGIILPHLGSEVLESNLYLHHCTAPWG